MPNSAKVAFEKDGTKAPAIICLHSTTYGSGKSSPAGIATRFATDPKALAWPAGSRGQDPRYSNNGMPDLNDPKARAAFFEGGRAAGLILAKMGFVTR